MLQSERKIRTLFQKSLFDLVYHKQKRISKWSIDFYLGCKFCIDVHGTWAHSKTLVIDRDQKKKLYLENEGFHYLVIQEEELSNIQNVKQKIEKFTLGFPRS
jgi:very-short-patch-repair endonuclease